jgi:hypothetical protein
MGRSCGSVKYVRDWRAEWLRVEWNKRGRAKSCEISAVRLPSYLLSLRCRQLPSPSCPSSSASNLLLDTHGYSASSLHPFTTHTLHFSSLSTDNNLPQKSFAQYLRTLHTHIYSHPHKIPERILIYAQKPNR